MPSSISSSNTNGQRTPYLRKWLITACLLACLLAVSEVYWRQYGFLPGIVDTKMWWSIHRDRVYGDNKIVILGASRAQLGIDPDVLEQELPGYDVIHLAIDGTWPYYALKDLAEDPAFNGIILCSIKAQWLLPFYHKRTKPYVDYYHTEYFKSSHLEDRIKAYIRVFLQEHFVIFSSELRLSRILPKRFRLYPSYQHMKANRYRPSLYHSIMRPGHLKSLRQMRYNREIRSMKPISRAQTQVFRRVVETELSQLHHLLRQRGGEFILIRMPSSEQYWETEQQCFPKQQLWDKIADWTGIPTVHFKDYPELARFECPDTSHLDAADVPQFTRNLARIIKQEIHDIE